MQPSPPLDYRETLDLLVEWHGRDVYVISHSQAPGETESHTQVTVKGSLGELQMVDNAIDPNADSVAGFPVGDDPRNAIYLSPGDFVRTMRLRPGHINIKFAHDFHIEVHLLD